jgi:hypothetical protein
MRQLLHGVPTISPYLVLRVNLILKPTANFAEYTVTSKPAVEFINKLA